jgi:hypothetical protein
MNEHWRHSSILRVRQCLSIITYELTLLIFQLVEINTLSGPEENKNAIFMHVAFSELNLVPFQQVSKKQKESLTLLYSISDE